jgi:ketosteroid isomerase-like protein
MMTVVRQLALAGLVLLGATRLPSLSAQPAVADTIRHQADQFIAAIASKQIDRFMALFTTEPDLTYVDNGRIYPSREALAAAAGGFFKRIGSASGTWESPRVLPLSSTAGAFTGILRPRMVDTDGKPLWTEGKIWTLVYQRRGGNWVIVQAHEVNAAPPR